MTDFSQLLAYPPPTEGGVLSELGGYNLKAGPLAMVLRRAARQVTRLVKAFSWSMRHGRVSDDERFALRLAVMHIRDGRLDLAEEDLAWLERRLLAAAGPPGP